jgi:uncharacterized protein YbjT (DUF2867 family)
VEKIILVTGATGYIGNCLIPLLLKKGYLVRVLVRESEHLQGRAWIPQVEVFRGDLLEPDSLKPALEHVFAAFYLVHSMASGRHYEARDSESACNFADMAEAAGLQQIIYLGGLAHLDERIGAHMHSRLQTGDNLRTSRVPVTEFRASLIIGSGSISFEMIRYLVEQVPVLVAPRDLKHLSQPIAVQDVMDYLLAALETPICRGCIYEIGGKDVLSYAEAMTSYAKVRGLKRSVLFLPWMPKSLMAFLVGRLTPVPAHIARPLIGGMRSSSVVCDEFANDVFPNIHPQTYRDSIQRALEQLTPSQLEPTWKNGGSSSRLRKEGFFIEHREIRMEAGPEAVYGVVSGMGGKKGWYYLDGLWKLRGFLDRLVGGPGLRGRSSETTLSESDIVDYYRVEALEPGRMLRLKAELKAPGMGWMEWGTTPDGEGTLLSQTAFFAPRGTLGFLYWYMLWPVHTLVFAGLIRAIARQAMKLTVLERRRHQ